MKLMVRNLGLIEQAELDIHPLTVFIGENGTNKTWVAYALYGLMRGFMRRSPEPLPAEFSMDEGGEEAVEKIKEDNKAIARSLAQRSEAGVSLERDFSKYFPGGSIRSTIRGTADFLRRLLRVPEMESAVDVELQFDRLEFNPERGPARIGVETSNIGVKLSMYASPARSLGEFLDDANAVRDARFWEGALSVLLGLWLAPASGDVFVLPAERKALASAHDLLRDEFSEAVSVPVADYAEFLRRHRSLKAHGAMQAGPSPLHDMSGILESRIVKGSIGFKPGAGGARFAFSPDERVELPIHAASSLVRALAGLDVYLRTAARPGDFLFIDELEMNAHPEAQLALMELVAMLVNRGIRVVMTTHSPYIVDHLNNLMAAARVAPERQDELTPHFQLGSREAFLPADKVAAYHFAPAGAKVEVRDVLDRETEAIDWRTFSRVTDALSNLYGRILEARERT